MREKDAVMTSQFSVGGSCATNFPRMLMRKSGTLIFFLCAVVSSIVVANNGYGADSASVPNVLFILADDMGYSDPGCFGGEIETPNLDRLAQGGLRFSHFYTASKCHCSRVTLLTGLYSYQAGPKIEDPRGYAIFNHQLDRGVTLAEVLKEAGYFTTAIGKWDVDKHPMDWGFDRYFGRPSLPLRYFGDTLKDCYLNRTQFTKAGGTDFYLTDAQTDHAIKFLDESKTTKKPFFLYLAYDAPHFPLQAREADVKKYIGRYKDGWLKVRERRIAKQRALGLLGPKTQVAPSSEYNLKDWDSLPQAERDWQDYLMAVYAGMVDRLDWNIGRVVAWLEKEGKLDNTLIVFCSDNGACPDSMNSQRTAHEKQFKAWQKQSSLFYGMPWAHVGDTPFRSFKGSQYQGGIASPCIVHWPARIKTPKGAINPTPIHLLDVMPTLVEVSGGTYPKTYKGRDVQPFEGVSILPALAGQAIQRLKPLYFQFANYRGLIDGVWKVVSFQGEPWELYHLGEDPTELVDRTAEQPEIAARLQAEWWHVARDVDRLPAPFLVPVAKQKKPLQERYHPGIFEHGIERMLMPQDVKPRPSGRPKPLSLDGLWRCAPDVFGIGRKLGYDKLAGDAGWREATVPGTIQDLGPEFASWTGRCWYRRQVTIPADWAGRRITLAGDGLFDRATIWINGAKAGEVDLPFLPWAVPVRAKAGDEIQLSIEVDSQLALDRAPGKIIGWRPIGGLLRSVRLEARPWTTLGLSALSTAADGSLTAAVGIERHGANAPVADRVLWRVETLDGTKLGSGKEKAVEAAAKFQTRLTGVRPWTPETPVLYRLVVDLMDQRGGIVDHLERRFGFRRIAVENGRLCLDGRPIQLVGANMHEDRPEAQFRWHESVRTDLKHMIHSGANCIRLCHYPHDPRVLDDCDELGLLALTEVPLWGSNPSGEGHTHRVAHARAQLESMIRRDLHHASVLLWSVSNETNGGRADAIAANRDLVELARRLDPSRPATHVSHTWDKHPDFTADDVVCINGYPSWLMHSGELRARDAAEWWRKNLAALVAACPGKPIIITEFGHPALVGGAAALYDEATQAAAIAHEATAFDNPAVCGTIVWCWADHLWPGGPGGLAVAPFGLLTRDRHPKPALAEAEKVWRQRRGLTGEKETPTKLK